MQVLCNWQPPYGFDHQRWIERFDRMQERYVLHRQQRFDLIADLLEAGGCTTGTILDLGCGSGALSACLLAHLPACRILAVDYDPSLLVLAQERFQAFPARARTLRADLRTSTWLDGVDEPVIAAVSSTALHWLSADELDLLYGQLAQLLPAGGFFLNSDHACPLPATIQPRLTQRTESALSAQTDETALSWDGFWSAYAEELGTDLTALQQDITGIWNGVEEGLPLQWHFEHLKQHGFRSADCFWRDCGEAVFGAVR